MHARQQMNIIADPTMQNASMILPGETATAYTDLSNSNSPNPRRSSSGKALPLLSIGVSSNADALIETSLGNSVRSSLAVELRCMSLALLSLGVGGKKHAGRSTNRQ